MVDFNKHTVDSAAADAKLILENVQKGLGFVPNMIGYMAEAPALAKAYTTLSGIFEKTSFTSVERQIVLLTVSRENTCHYCVAAHTSIAQMQDVPVEVIRALRDGTAIEDPKLEALHKLATLLVKQDGFIDAQDLEDFFAAGYTQQHVLEIIVGIGLKTLSNYTNHIIDTEVDDAFAANAWKR